MTARTSPVPTPSPGFDPDLGDRAGHLGVDVVLHLHRLEHEDRLAGLDRVADATSTFTIVPCIGALTVPSPVAPRCRATPCSVGAGRAPRRHAAPRARRAATPSPCSGGRRPRPAPCARRASSAPSGAGMRDGARSPAANVANASLVDFVLDPLGRVGDGAELGCVEQREVRGDRRAHALDLELAERPEHPLDRAVAIGRPHDQLADRGCRSTARSCRPLVAAVPAHAGPGRNAQLGDRARATEGSSSSGLRR